MFGMNPATLDFVVCVHYFVFTKIVTITTQMHKVTLLHMSIKFVAA